MIHPVPRRRDAVSQARVALRQMELAIRRARFDRTDDPSRPDQEIARHVTPRLKIRQNG